jgi:hypothetical protein
VLADQGEHLAHQDGEGDQVDEADAPQQQEAGQLQVRGALGKPAPRHQGGGLGIHWRRLGARHGARFRRIRPAEASRTLAAAGRGAPEGETSIPKPRRTV